MRQPGLLFAVAVGSALLGFASGRFSRREPELAPRLGRIEARLEELAAAREIPRITTCAATVDGAQLRAELQRALRGEAVPVAATAPVAPPVEARPNAENEAALDRGRQLVRRALDTHRWTESDIDAFKHLVPQLSNEGRDELFQTLLPALNDGRIVADVQGRLF